MHVVTKSEGMMSKEPLSNNISTSGDASEVSRARFIRKWIDGKLQRWAGLGVAGGLGSTVLALPALAQATDAQLEAFQFAETIPGVRSVKLLANGDLQLKMADGRTVIIDAENVQVLDNGAIMAADAVVDDVSQFSAAAETAGATAVAGGGLGGMGAVLGGLGLAGAAAAAAGGGGGGSDDDTPPPSVTPTPPQPPAPPEPALPILNLADVQGSAINQAILDTPIPAETATVEVTIGSVVTTATPALDGSWSVSLTPIEAASLPQGDTFVTVRTLDALGEELSVDTIEYTVDTISPTVTITNFSDGAVMNAEEQGTPLTISGTTDAENGQTVTVSVDGQTLTGTVSGGNWSVQVPAADLAGLADASTIAVTADVSDFAGNPAPQATNSFDTDFTGPTLSLNPVGGGSIDLIDVSGDLVLTGTTSAEDGQTVTVSFEGKTYTGTASGGSWSVTVPNADLSGLTTGTPAAVSVWVSDVSGNPAPTVTVSIPVDLTGPSININPLSVGSVLNAVEVGSDLTISGATGKVTDGQTVTVTLDGETYTGTVTGGAWSVTVPASDLGPLADGGSFSVTADVSDTDGLAAPQASVGLSKDVTAPTISIDSFSHGAVLNAAEQGSDLTLTGSTSAEDGQTVTLQMNGETYTATATSGAWSVTVPTADLGALTDGATITATADVSDSAGNPAVQGSASFDTDFSAPSLSISTLSDGAVMNAAEQGTDLLVSGTSDAVDGTVVTVQIQRPDSTVDISGTATVSGGNWTYTATSGDLAALQDGTTYDVNASVADAAGNSAAATTSFDTDFAAPSLSIDPLSVGPVLDIIEQGSDLTVSGTTNAQDGQIVTVDLDGESYSATVSGGVWSTSVPSSDLAALADATGFTLTASVADSSGNPASATTSLTTDFQPILRMDAVGSNDAVPLADAQASGLTVSGTSFGLTPGQSFDVTLNTTPVGTATVAPDGTWSLAVNASEFAGFTATDTLDFSATTLISGAPASLTATDQAIAHVPAAYVITEAGRSGSTVTFEIHADPDRDISSGFAITADMAFDPSVVTFDAGSDTENSDFDLFLVNPGSGIVSFAGAATSYSDLSQPVVTFTMTVQDPNSPIELTLTTPDGGPSQLHLGTAANDTLTGTGQDDFIRGADGDDTIDLSGAGRDIVVFEADPAKNGVDTITGFTLGAADEVSDAFIFADLVPATLRGDGTGIETLSTGDALGADTGIVSLDTQLSDLSNGTIAAAAESLTGAQAGDEIYLLASDGTDSVLVKVDYDAPASVSLETVAQFDGLADLSNFHPDNILHTDPTGASA